MIVILSPDEVKGKKPVNLHNLNVSLKEIYSGEHQMLEVCEDDVILVRSGHNTTILKGPGKKLK